MPAVADGDPEAEGEEDMWAREVEASAQRFAAFAVDDGSDDDDYQSESMPDRRGACMALLRAGLARGFR